MTNARYLATLSSETPAKRYARDSKGSNWTYTKTDAYRFETKREAELAAAAGANSSGGVPAVQKAPVAPHTRQRRQTASRLDT